MGLMAHCTHGTLTKEGPAHAKQGNNYTTDNTRDEHRIRHHTGRLTNKVHTQDSRHMRSYRTDDTDHKEIIVSQTTYETDATQLTRRTDRILDDQHK